MITLAGLWTMGACWTLREMILHDRRRPGGYGPGYEWREIEVEAILSAAAWPLFGPLMTFRRLQGWR